VTYFSLRKPGPEPEPEQAVEQGEHDEHEAEQAEEEQHVEAPPTSWGGAILAGLRGPGGWLTAHLGAGPAWGMHVVAGWACLYYGGWVTVGVVVAWLFAVGAFVPREFLERAAAAVERRDKERHTPTVAPAPGVLQGSGRDGVVRLLYEVMGDAPAVHLRTVLNYLQEHGQWEGREVAELRQHLEALGIPVQPKVKIGGTPTRGVLRADLDALPPIATPSPSPAPSPAV
jgi:hypothetical protein